MLDPPTCMLKRSDHIFTIKCALLNTVVFILAGEEITKKGVDRANGDKSVILFDKVRYRYDIVKFYRVQSDSDLLLP